MKIVCFGEIMLRLSPPNTLRIAQTSALEAVFGGSEANVAVSLAQLGLPAEYITRVPDQVLGRAALGALNQFGVDTSKCCWGGDRLGIYFLEYGAGLRATKVLYDRQHSGMATLTPGMIDWPAALAGVTWFHWSGITPALSASAAAATLEAVQTAARMGIRISCDLNYRDKLWQYGQKPAQIMPALFESTDTVLGDANALDIYFGIKAADNHNLLKSLADRFPQLQYIAMSHREGHSASDNTYGALLYTSGDFFESRRYNLPDMVDRIGGGDALMAGLVFGIHRMPQQPQEIIEFAAAAAALKHYIKGDFNLSTESEVRALMAGNTGGKVSR